MKTLIKQLLLLIAITSVITLFLITIGVNVFVSILTSLVIQFALYYGFNYIVDSFTLLRIRKIELEQLKELSFQTTEVTCPCSATHKQIVPLRFNTDNQYTCISCQKLIKVYINIDTALATQPILETNIQKINIPKINDTE